MSKRITSLFATILLATSIGCTTTHDDSSHLVDAAKPKSTEEEQRRRDLMVGTWFGEAKTKDGGSRMHIVQRKEDGSAVILFRAFEPDGTVQNSAEVNHWGLDGDIYFSMTRGWLNNSGFKPADITRAYFYDAYKVISLSEEKFEYQHIVSGNRYEVKRVEDGFQFPK